MAYRNTLEFEKPIVEIEKLIEEMKHFSPDGGQVQNAEIKRLHKKANKLKKEIYAKLSPWEITQVARHPQRPYSIDYFKEVFDDFIELHGDRNYGDDKAIVGGLARLDGTPVVVVGTQKGRTTKEKIFRNFGMPNPEGYRKCLRLFNLAERFNRPIVTLVDTPGAYPGVGAEERGQAEAIAKNLLVMSTLKVPILSVIIGEGGSGGALALAVADTVMMFQFSTYSVISPEGCAAILWKDSAKSEAAAKQLKITAKDLKKLGLIDSIIEEPLGGAHRNPGEAIDNLKTAIVESLDMLTEIPLDTLLDARYEKFRNMGVFKSPDDEK